MSEEEVERTLRHRSPQVLVAFTVLGILALGVLVRNLVGGGIEPAPTPTPPLSPLPKYAATRPSPSPSLSPVSFAPDAGTKSVLWIERGNLNRYELATGKTSPVAEVPQGRIRAFGMIRTENSTVFVLETPSDTSAYALSDGTQRVRKIGEAIRLFASADPRRVWLVRNLPEGIELREVNADTELATGKSRSVFPVGTFPHAAIRGGILATTVRGEGSPEEALELWDPASVRRTRTITEAFGGLIAADPDRFAWRSPGCSVPGEVCDLKYMTIENMTVRSIAASAEGSGFINGGGFGEGEVLAAFDRTQGKNRTARLVLVDLSSGSVSGVPGGEVGLGEEVGYAQWSGRWVVFSGSDGNVRLYGTGDPLAWPLPIRNMYSFVVTS